MNKKTFLTLSATALAATLTLAGCAADSGSGGHMPGMDHSTSAGSPSGSATAAATLHNAADTMFAQMMIPHHAQAVEMSDMVLEKQDIPAPVRDLATRIKAAQGPEIDTMTAWLKSWNESTTAHSGHGMEGMMGEAEMAQLEAAQGTEAAKLFLNQMITHHEGAVTMAKAETADGVNPDAVNLSKVIVTAQEAEIVEMRNLLGTL
ncbi:DUF305 domain-containing protein [Arthrobacter sp.]|uniref:DUF305 domain-containing protein n=1 Tax=Arthrobacter sp. TaxID=1667 RepID=UPI00281218BE|nr:DUF305 domain-containing protein [Arthrobacter sp.]